MENKTYVPTHRDIARAEHYLVRNRREYNSLMDSGNMTPQRDLELTLEASNIRDFLNRYKFRKQEMF